MDGQLLPIPLRLELMMTPEQKALIDAVAAELHLKTAPGYEDHWACIFTLPDGGRLYFSTGRQKGSLHVSAGLPDNLRDHRAYYRSGEAPKTSINVSDTKTADRIAADIRRRLLPEHDREVAGCTANKSRRDEFTLRCIRALTSVAAPLGEHVICDERTGEPRPLSIDREGKFNLTAKTCCDSVKVEIETSPDNAGKIAAMLATL
jgi:hypothetical protein